MCCRQCQGIEVFFDDKEARRELKNYRKKGPAKTTQMLVDAILKEGVDRLTLLDIGGGVGAIQNELLKAGAASAQSVDASSAYIDAATEEARRQGHSDRVNIRHGNFVDIASEIEPAEIVTLDRAICCYHDMESLVGLSSIKATKLYGLVYPRNTWGARIVFSFFNLFFRLRRNPFRVFLHPTASVDALVRRSGLERLHYQQTLVWQVVVYGRQ